MHRRTLLARTGALVPAAAVGLAGCSSDQSQSAEVDCQAPSTADVTALLPAGVEGLERSGADLFENTTAETGGQMTQVLAQYDGSDGTYWVTISRFPSAENASREFDAAVGQESPGRGAVGYLRVDEYLYGAGGSSEGQVRQLLTAAEPLSGDCVEANVQWQ